MARESYGGLEGAAWLQTAATYSQSDWPSDYILSGSRTFSHSGRHIIETSSSISLTVPIGTRVYIFADGRGATEPAYIKSDTQTAYATMNISSEPEATITMSPNNYYMRGSFTATKDATISVYGNFMARDNV